MPRVAREKSKSGIYHVMVRGANKQEIFHDDVDRIKFLKTLKRYKDVSAFQMYAWCLMGNHVHLLLKEGTEDFSITMKRIGVCYVTYYNLKYKATGHLFQDRFKSETVETERYFLVVARYIHQNPVKAGLVTSAADWRWSSYRGYIEATGIFPDGLLDTRPVLDLFSKDRDTALRLFKEYSLAANDDACLDEGVGERIRLTDEEALQLVREILPSGVNIAQVKGLPKPARDEIIRKITKLDGVSQRQTARILGVSPSLVFKA
ncbi:MAG: transposase [Firmicutes bacterium]|nr:transposase [Bacillota bacterium]